MASESENRMVEFALSEQLVLAGQPQPQDWAKLARRGFKTIVNIRSDSQRALFQAKQAEAVGLHYIHLPLPAYELEPQHLATFNQIMNRAADRGKTLLHCRSASRTGLLWMLKRTVHDGWLEIEAEAELRAAGYQNDNIDTFLFCADDYSERTILPELHLEAVPFV
jgi:uncharacterized protein (TIGR01244 family)